MGVIGVSLKKIFEFLICWTLDSENLKILHIQKQKY
jgi:hypothetical protein